MMRWLRPVLFVASADLRHMLRQRETLLWAFVMPIVFMYFFGMVNGSGGSGDRKLAIALVNEGPPGGPLLDALVARLEAEDYRVDRDLPKERSDRYRRRLTVPAPKEGRASFSAAVLAGDETVLRFRRTGSGDARDHDRFRVNKAVYSLLAEIAAIRAKRDELDAEAFQALRDAPRNISLEIRSAGKRKEIPGGRAQAIPGTMVMFILMIMLTGGAITLVIEREKGLLRRLASAPLTRGEIVFGKFLGKLLLGIVQLTFAVSVSVLLFGMDWGPHAPIVGVVLVSWAMFCTALGLVLGNLARSEAQMSGVGVISSLLLAALGGCWWPIEITPEWMQTIGRSIPTGWAMTGLHRLVSFQEGGSAVLPQLLGLWIGTLALGVLARRTFRYF